MERHILPFLGKMTISDVSMQHILAVCRPLEEDGSLEMCRRIRQILGQVFHYALVTGRIKADPSVALDGAFHAPSVNHHATMTNPDDIGDLLRHINAYRSPVVRLALKFSILTICRPGEIRYAEWKEIDFEKAEWKIPPEKMKMKRPHIVPLATQTIEVLDELKILTGDGRYLFPSLRSRERPISSETMRVALRSMGYRKDEITPHGFRAMASTILNENGFMPDVIERQLAHVEKNKVRAAYNHAEYLDQRREMLQWWGNWLLELKHL
jgi:integrase